MTNFRLIYLYITTVFFLTGFYLFKKGMQFGEWNYKRSIKFQMTLDAAYKYGYEDCVDNHG